MARPPYRSRCNPTHCVLYRRRRARRHLRRRPDIGCARIVQRHQALHEASPCPHRRRPLRRLRRTPLEQLHLSDPAERHLRQRLTGFQLSSATSRTQLHGGIFGGLPRGGRRRGDFSRGEIARERRSP